MLLLAILFISMLVFAGLGGALAQNIWQVNIAELTLDDPDTSTVRRFMITIQQIGMFILPALLFAQLISDNNRSYLSAHKFPPFNFILAAILLLFCALPVIEVLIKINSAIPASDTLKEFHDQNVAASHAIMQDGRLSIFLLNILIFAIIPAIGEELIFRSLIQKLIYQMSNNIHIGIWVSAAVFSLIHFQVYHAIPMFAMGLLFGYLLIWSGSIFLPMLVHFLNNLITITIEYLQFHGKLSEEVTETISTPLISGIFVLLVTGILFYMKKNSNWKELRPFYLNN